MGKKKQPGPFDYPKGLRDISAHSNIYLGTRKDVLLSSWLEIKTQRGEVIYSLSVNDFCEKNNLFKNKQYVKEWAD